VVVVKFCVILPLSKALYPMDREFPQLTDHHLERSKGSDTKIVHPSADLQHLDQLQLLSKSSMLNDR